MRRARQMARDGWEGSLVGKFNEHERPFMDRLLLELRDRLAGRGLTAVYVSDEEDRPCLEVLDRNLRARRVYVYVAFLWFIWGDQHDERTSCYQLDEATEVIEAAARAGWHAEGQGPVLQEILDTYQS
jgi:hypothetical protein